MKFRKFIPVALSCLFLLETPFTSMAASVPLTESNAAVSDAGMEISSGNMQAQKAAGKQTSLKLKTESLTIFTENTYQLRALKKSDSLKKNWAFFSVGIIIEV